MDLKNFLGVGDLVALLTLSQRSLSCRDISGLKQLVADLGGLIGFEYATLAQAKIPDVFLDPQATIHSLDISYPVGYMDLYMQNRLYLTDATICTFLSNLEPVHWRRVDQHFEKPYPAAALSLDLGMVDGWTHGILDTATMTCTEMALGWPKEEKDPRTETIVAYTIPFIAQAYRRLSNGQGREAIHLTGREKEVLNWLKEGKNSWEISMILQCSRRVVDFHVANIKNKLNCTSRSQAIATALHHGLIQF